MNSAKLLNEKERLMTHIESLLAEGIGHGHFAFNVEVQRMSKTKTQVVVAAGRSEQFVFREDEFLAD